MFSLFLFNNLLASEFSDCFKDIYKYTREEINNKVEFCFNNYSASSIDECVSGASYVEGYQFSDKKFLFCKSNFPPININQCLNISSHLVETKLFDKNINECFLNYKLEDLSECQQLSKKGILQEQKSGIYKACLKSNSHLINSDFCDKNLDQSDLKDNRDLPIICSKIYYKLGFKNCTDKAHDLKNSESSDIIIIECLEKEKLSFSYCMEVVKELKNGMYKFGAMNICLKKREDENSSKETNGLHK